MASVLRPYLKIAWAVLLATTASARAGMTWTYPQTLNATGTSDGVRQDYYPNLATDGNGDWVAVWASRDLGGGPFGDDMDIFTAHSADNGVTWTTPAPVDPAATSDDLHDSDPAVFTDGDGHWLVVWGSWDSGASSDIDLLYATSTNGIDWTVRGYFNSDHDSDILRDHDATPDIKVDASGAWAAVWQKRYDSPSGDEGDIYAARSTDHGTTWSPATLLHASMASDAGDDIVPRLAGHDGVLAAMWRSDGDLSTNGIGADTDMHWSRSTDGGQTWSDPAPLNNDFEGDNHADYEGDIATDGAGTWLAVWYRALDGTGDRDLYFARSTDSATTWSDPQPLNTNWATDLGDEARPRIVGDGSGHWVVAWYSTETLGLPIGGDRDVLFARSCDDGLHWAPPAVLNGNAMMDLTASDWGLELALGADAAVLAAWYSTDSLGGTAGNDRDILLARSTIFVCGDTDTDGRVGLRDFAVLQQCWNAPATGDCEAMDFNANGLVDEADLAMFVGKLGEIGR